MDKKFDDLFEVSRFLAERLAKETPVGWYREAAVREEEGGTYTLTHLTDPLTGSTYTTYTPGPGEIKFTCEPCRDRGTECPHTGLMCTEDDEVCCTAEYLHDRIGEAFSELAKHPDDPAYRYWGFCS